MNSKLILLIIFNETLNLFLCCYQGCKCYETNVDCKRASLDKVPTDFPISVTFMDLSFANLKYLPKNSFEKFKNLNILKLSNNNIKVIDKDAFFGLINLKDLHLEHNDLSYLDPETFNKNCNNVLRVYLTGNKFETIPVLKSSSMTKLNLDSNKISSAYVNESFLLNTNLQTLDLTSNQIKYITDTDFVNLKNTQLLTLKIKMNSLENITSGAFSHVKKSIKNLELDRNELLDSQMIENALKGLTGAFQMQYLDLKECGLKNIFENFLKPFSGSKLHQLDLSGNSKLDFIHVNAFDGLVKVQYLHLERCKLSNLEIRFSPMTELKQLFISSNAFQTCPHSFPASLEVLDLQSNDLRKIKKDDFKSLTNLKKLNLQNNKILSIEIDSFSDLNNLLTLDLGFNRLNKIDSRIFFRMSALISLNLEKQNPCLSEISLNSFVLQNLRSLKLEGNCIEFNGNQQGVFANVPRLTNLSLKGNHLKRLSEGLFTGCSNIEFIDLSSNEIIGWPSATFLPLIDSVVGVDLRMNKLSFISIDSSSDNYLPNDFKKLTNISLENNVWNCTCSSVVSLFHFRKKITNEQNILCEYPYEKVGRKLFSTMDNCSNLYTIYSTSTSQKFHSIGLLVALFIIIGILVALIWIYRKKIFLLFQKMKKNGNSYRRLNESNGIHNTICHNNPLLIDLMENNDNSEVSGSLRIRNEDIADPFSWEDKLSKDSEYDREDDIVAISENIAFKSSKNLEVYFISDLSSYDHKKISCYCERLVIDCLFNDFDTIDKILKIRQKKTFIFYESDDSIIEIKNKYPPNKCLTYMCYDPEDILASYYKILD